MTQVTPLTTNRAEASAIILAGHAAKILPAQNGLNGTYFAIADDGTRCRCAIGLLYPEAEAQELEGGGADGPGTDYLMARGLIAQGLLIVPDNERQWFTDIQEAHDTWTITGGTGNSGEVASEAAFLDLLQ